MGTLYLIRHGRPEFAGGGKRCIGITDVPLSKEGRQQFRELREKLKSANIRKIYVSPLSRSRESGEILAGLESLSDMKLREEDESLTGETIPVITKENLREISMGSWENRTFADIREEEPEAYAARGENFADFTPEGGESFRDCQARAWMAYREILAELDSDDNIAIVGHAGFFRALICLLEGRDLNKLMDIPMDYAECYTWDLGPALGAVIASAGLSSRMNSFKPLLPVKGQSFLQREITTLFRAGVRHITIVTGREKELVEAEVAGPGVICVHNEAYLTTKMFDSALLGLHSLPEWLEGTFFLPVDAPIFSLFTVRQEQAMWRENDAKIFQPWCHGIAGHPLLIRKTAFPDIFSFDGFGGLRRFCKEHQDMPEYLQMMNLPDPGSIMDADSPEEYEAICRYEEKLGIPDRERCLELLSWIHVPAHLLAHSLAVTEKAIAMADAFNRSVEGKGKKPLDLTLVEAAALLHDIAKGRKKHGKVGADWLRQLGFRETADAMEYHEHLPERMRGEIDEAAIVYLADKLIIEDKEQPLDERYRKRLEQYSGDPEAEEAIRGKWRAAAEMMVLYESCTKKSDFCTDSK